MKSLFSLLVLVLSASTPSWAGCGPGGSCGPAPGSGCYWEWPHVVCSWQNVVCADNDEECLQKQADPEKKGDVIVIDLSH